MLSKPALLFWKLWVKVKSKTYLSEPHKKSTAEIFFSSMSRTISPDLKLNLSFYVDLASDFEINPISKKYAHIFSPLKSTQSSICLGAQVNVLYTRGHIFIYTFVSELNWSSCISKHERQFFIRYLLRGKWIEMNQGAARIFEDRLIGRKTQ